MEKIRRVQPYTSVWQPYYELKKKTNKKKTVLGKYITNKTFFINALTSIIFVIIISLLIFRCYGKEIQQQQRGSRYFHPGAAEKAPWTIKKKKNRTLAKLWLFSLPYFILFLFKFFIKVLKSIIDQITFLKLEGDYHRDFGIHVCLVLNTPEICSFARVSRTSEWRY